ncbi:hypothetical protein GCM10023155_17370 [Bremerella cremea]
MPGDDEPTHKGAHQKNWQFNEQHAGSHLDSREFVDDGSSVSHFADAHCHPGFLAGKLLKYPFLKPCKSMT